MKKILLVLPLVLSLGACATLTQKIETAWQIVTSASVSPTQIIVAGNAFDAAKASATQYLKFCHDNSAIPACALKIRKQVVAAVRAGTTARDQLEPYVVAGTAGPAAIYNTLIATITTLQNNIPATGAAK